ncbi:PIG-L deacetylase family protein [Legionella fallonii]|uniref:Putative N-acetylglucosaminyl phosphatidylinositol deacetylase n=1 Tax=Legionella fallonii LLAP-10 TaxID=1212491 RepID=A0A098GBY8_9GAMM|nr:PIG-L family deacetylase [Legionella fallonii]CEG59001.1 putative N-acetylglucosaminyl phosphatidylinositol deacetylase [Legionella fallonii LLAP-10]
MTELNKKQLNICFVSPHPDDVELYCGGVLLDHAKKNHRLSVIMMTYGGKGTINPFLRGEPLEKIREQEARARYNLLDNLEFIFAGFKDTKVLCDKDSIARLATILKTINPDIIYLPEFNSQLSERQHNDHIHSGKIILAASKQLTKPVTMRCYHSISINRLINIDEYYEQNNEAIKFYKSQKGFPIWPFLSSLTRFHYHHNKKRSRWGKDIGVAYAEGFREFV